jgi:SseB protein C-terminal domain/SseB protein N-terminal domain
MEELTELERALAEVTHEPSREDELRRLLVEGELYVLGEEVGAADGERRELRLVHHTLQGTTYLSAYTSPERAQAVAPGQPYLVLRGRAVLDAVTPGVQLVINLGSWPNRSFTHDEATRLARFGKPGVHQPERYPSGLLEALWTHFRDTEGVLEAHLAEIVEDGAPGRLLIAFSVAHPASAEKVAEEAKRLASTVHDAEVRLHHLGSDELSRLVLEAGVCFFDRAQLAAGPAGFVPS